MADIASSDVTVTVERRAIEGKTRRNRVKIVFGNGTLTYPAGGVPMPAASAFGMKVRLDYLTVFDSDDASGIMWKYDRENKKLRAFVQGAAHAAAGAATLDDYAVTAAFGVSAGISIAREAAAGAVTSRWGALPESASGAGNAPAAATLYAEAVGW
jgi:hypothetical protein